MSKEYLTKIYKMCYNGFRIEKEIKEMIIRIAQHSKAGTNRIYTMVFYQNGNTRRIRRFNEKNELPMTVVNFILNASKYAKIYTETGKSEYYTNV